MIIRIYSFTVLTFNTTQNIIYRGAIIILGAKMKHRISRVNNHIILYIHFFSISKKDKLHIEEYDFYSVRGKSLSGY